MNKKEKNGLLWLILCIPIPIIIYLGILYSQNEISPDEISSVVVTDISGLQGEYSDRESVDFFVNLILNAENVDGAWRDFSDETPIELSFKRKNGTSFKHYVYAELDTSGCFVMDKDGKVKRISQSDAKELLMHAEWKYLYEPLLLPKLTVVCTEGEDEASGAIPPCEYDWQYKKTNGVFGTDDDTKLIGETFRPVFIKAENKYDFKFSRDPDVVKVSLRNGDMILEAGSLGALYFTADTELTAEIEATWNRSEDKDCYGTGKWSFKIVYDISPKADIEKTSYYPGEIAAIRFTNLSEGENAELETTLKTSELKTVSSDGYKLALIPISAENAAGTYDLRVTVGGIPFDFSVEVKEKTFETVRIQVGAEKFNEASKPDNKSALAQLISDLTENSIYGALYDDMPFMAPASDVQQTMGYGTAVIYNNSDPPYVKYRGVDFDAGEGTTVFAAQRGKIVYNGETAETGKTIIIDHGNGVLSYYCHLSSAQAGTEQVVQKGEIIGAAGDTGLTDKSKLCFAVSVNGIFVDPAFLMADGLAK